MNKIKKIFQSLSYCVYVFNGITDVVYFIIVGPFFMEGFLWYILWPYIALYNFFIETYRGYMLY